MIDAANPDARRAEEARAKLLSDIREIKKMGNKMIDQTETAIHKAPALLGLGALGLALVGIAVFAGRRKPRRILSAAPQRSFLAEAARSAALSALGVLSGRVTQRLLSAAMQDSPSAREA